MDLCDEVSSSSSYKDEDDPSCDMLTKKRKHFTASAASAAATGNMDTSLFKAYGNTSSDGKTSLVILKQPEKQHRARYHTEGSRGAVKDRGQNGFPTVQLRGYDSKKSAVLQVFVGSDTGTPIPHLYYQACKVSGKNSTPCREMKKENTDVILIDMDPDKDRIVVCDCVGILKERHSDIEGKVPPNKRVNWKKKTTKCRIVFRTEIEAADGSLEILQVVTDTISCTQLPGTPEILKMSMATCSIEGGEELWIIGKNFLKDTEVIFKEDSNIWCEKVKPIKEFFSNNHLIVVIPPYKDPNLNEAVVVNISVKCGSKTSEPRPLTLKPAQSLLKLNGVLHSANNGLAVVNLTNGSAHNLMMMQCKEEPLTSASITPRPTILEQIEEHSPIKNVGPHVSRVSKKRRERKTPFSRSREQPDINADEAMFDTVDSSSTSLDRAVNWSAFLKRHTANARQASADRLQQVQQQDQKPIVVENAHAYRQQILISDETTATLNNEKTYMEETSNHMANNQQPQQQQQQQVICEQNTQVTSPTAHFENLSFHPQASQEPLSFAGISKTGFKLASAADTSTFTQQSQPQAVLRGAEAAPAAVVEHYQTSDQQNAPSAASNAVVNTVNTAAAANVAAAGHATAELNPVKHENACSLGIDNSGSESATISIKLPPSVLQDQKQLSTIVNTISKALQPQEKEAAPASNQTASTFSPEMSNDPNVSPQTYQSPQTWQQSPPDNSATVAASGQATASNTHQETSWISQEDNGFEKKRKRVLESEFTTTASAEAEATSSWNTQAASADQSDQAWSNQTQTAWAVATSTLANQTTWNTEPVVSEAKNNNVDVTTTSCWTTYATSSTEATSFVNTTTHENSSDSGNCTKWENIDPKPLDQWNETTAFNQQTWTSAAEETSWTDTKTNWGTNNQQPMDSTIAVVSTAAEMMPVNPKEVSPMDVDDILKYSSTTTATAAIVTPVFVTSVISKHTPIVVSTVSASLNTNSTVDIINSYTT